ncbi:MAG: FumA C-terminus/TtdB family hydratase beta subunit [Candidatus Altiarchaeota archaeon]
MAIVRLKTPISEKEVRMLRAGDTVYLSGIVHTARDKANKRMLEEGKTPVHLGDGVLFHCGPLVRRNGRRWEVVGLGPTTSSRMDKYTPQLIVRFKPRIIIGKGGVDEKSASAFRKHGIAYLSMTGGCAASSAKSVRKVLDVRWKELGLAEAMWTLEVEELGPLTVAIDTSGGNFYRRLSRRRA